MQFATRVRAWRVARLDSETALSRKPFGIGHTYIHTFLVRMTDTVGSQNTDLSSWDTLYKDSRNLHVTLTCITNDTSIPGTLLNKL
jgi:hypothetical protein